MSNIDHKINLFLENILQKELIPASGCTEPISVAFAASKARCILDEEPVNMEIYASGNMIKNTKAVYIPNGGDLRGIDAAAILGMLNAKEGRGLEILKDTDSGTIEKAKALLNSDFCTVKIILGDDEPLHFFIKLYSIKHYVEVEVEYEHTNIVNIIKDGEKIESSKGADEKEQQIENENFTIENILTFTNSFSLNSKFVAQIKQQIQENMRIAEEGLNKDYGLSIGKHYIAEGKNEIAYAAAASDARMSGCTLPVVIVSGSGNQGITASLPVVVYAKRHNKTDEEIIRAVTFSDLIAIKLKMGIGRLSAYCGAVCAATGSGSAFTYLDGGSVKQIEDTITNSLAIMSGMFCDGAKPSCAAKIAMSMECADMSHKLAMNGIKCKAGEGIVMSDIEKTAEAVGKLAKEGMKSADQMILELMINNK